MPSWKKLISSGSSAELQAITLSGLSDQSSEPTVLTINGSNVVGTSELGSLAYSSATYDNYSSWTLAGDTGTQTISSTNTATVAGTAPISTVAAATDTVTVSIDNDGITDTHLAYNTGQHLTTTSNVNFADICGSGL